MRNRSRALTVQSTHCYLRVLRASSSCICAEILALRCCGQMIAEVLLGRGRRRCSKCPSPRNHAYRNRPAPPQRSTGWSGNPSDVPVRSGFDLSKLGKEAGLTCGLPPPRRAALVVPVGGGLNIFLDIRRHFVFLLCSCLSRPPSQSQPSCRTPLCSARTDPAGSGACSGSCASSSITARNSPPAWSGAPPPTTTPRAPLARATSG